MADKKIIATSLIAGVTLALAVALTGAWLVRAHPFVGTESATYLANALDGRPFLQELFDVQKNDLGNYQGRELSYATDLLDGAVVAAWFRWRGSFVPISLAQLLMIVVVVASSVAWLRARAASLGAAAMLPALLFVSSASTILGVRHFRTAKSLSAAALAALAWILVRALFDEPRDVRGSPRTGSLVATFVVASILALADRQGTFFVVLLAAITWHCAPRSPFVASLVLAAALGTVYDLWIGPSLVLHFGHQQVNWAYQQGTADPFILAHAANWNGVLWLLDSFSVGAGALGLAWGGLVWVGAAGLAWRAGGRRWVFRVVLATAALVVLSVLMKWRHAPIIDPSVRITYYNGPLLALGSVGLSLVLARLAARGEWQAWRPRVIAVGVVLVLLNLASVPRLAGRPPYGTDAPYIPVTTALVRCIENPADDALDHVPSGVGWLGRYHRLCERYRALRTAR
ncbi:MAG: hypothetical protein ACHQQR_07680 [Gemmatimonadales bacterium]